MMSNLYFENNTYMTNATQALYLIEINGIKIDS